LLKHLVDSYWGQLVKFEHLASIHSLKVKYEQVIFFPCMISGHQRVGLNLHACLQCVDNGGTNGAAVMDLRRRIDERAVEREEEERYFNEDRYISSFLTTRFFLFFM
jgi:protein phosphatase-4 regulatory subunit 3